MSDIYKNNMSEFFAKFEKKDITSEVLRNACLIDICQNLSYIADELHDLNEERRKKDE